MEQHRKEQTGASGDVDFAELDKWTRQAQYRDRAKERRQKFGMDDSKAIINPYREEYLAVKGDA